MTRLDLLEKCLKVISSINDKKQLNTAGKYMGKVIKEMAQINGEFPYAYSQFLRTKLVEKEKSLS